MEEGNISGRGDSLLTQYVHHLYWATEKLRRCVERDAQAIAIFTSPGLHHAEMRAEQIRWAPHHGRKSVSRVWTRRDAARMRFMHGLFEGSMAQPECRVGRLLRRLHPEEGFGRHDVLFQSVVDEARNDGTAASVVPLATTAHEQFRALLSAAHSISQDDDEDLAFDTAEVELYQTLSSLIRFLPAPRARGTDGPCDPYSWRYDGNVYAGMTAKPWNFAAVLFSAMPNRVPLDDLAHPVLQDAVELVTADAAGSWRREANNFFKQHGIPLANKILQQRYAIMVEI